MTRQNQREDDRAPADDQRAPTVLVAGTASHVGKSTIVAGLCRRLADSGLSVAPFKAQNMSNNARVGVTPDGDWGELGVSQYVQARAARTAPSTDHNPVLLKPHGDGESQLVVDGEAVGHYAAGEYYDEHWERVREAAAAAHERLASEHDVVVAEGAGSIAEINLHDRDLANVETARFADATVLVVGDVERGGVFASLYGTLELMPADCRERVGGLAISKFRGDQSILDAGIDELEDRTGVPVLDVLPHDDPGLPEEDSLGLPEDASGDGPGPPVVGDGDGVPADRSVTVGVVRLPHVSNFTDFEPLARTPGVRVAYLDPDAAATGGLGDVDASVLPGTKNTVDDLRALHAVDFGDALDAFDGPVLGVCGGYQMLGDRITNAGVESTGNQEDVVAGFGLLPVETRFSRDKRVESVTLDAAGGGPLPSLAGTASGYEIHMGETERLADLPQPLEDGSAATDDAVGTYLHGLFENDAVREAFLDAVYRDAGRERPDAGLERPNPYDAAASLVAGLDPTAADADWLGDPLPGVRKDE